jgi:hypothetical protein
MRSFNYPLTRNSRDFASGAVMLSCLATARMDMASASRSMRTFRSNGGCAGFLVKYLKKLTPDDFVFRIFIG